MDGRCTRVWGTPSSRLFGVFDIGTGTGTGTGNGNPFCVIVGALVGTLFFDCLCPSVKSMCAETVFAEGFLEEREGESRGGGFQEWGDKITFGAGVWSTEWHSSSMRESCRKGRSRT